MAFGHCCRRWRAILCLNKCRILARLMLRCAGCAGAARSSLHERPTRERTTELSRLHRRVNDKSGYPIHLHADNTIPNPRPYRCRRSGCGGKCCGKGTPRARRRTAPMQLLATLRRHLSYKTGWYRVWWSPTAGSPSSKTCHACRHARHRLNESNATAVRSRTNVTTTAAIKSSHATRNHSRRRPSLAVSVEPTVRSARPAVAEARKA